MNSSDEIDQQEAKASADHEQRIADRDEAVRETAKHIRRVQSFLAHVTDSLIQRAIVHDRSKWSEEEWPYFAEATRRLRGISYGSEEYKASLASIKPAIDHHNACNSHHPEYHDGDITAMSLLDLIEMLADWRAATERHADGCILKSLEINAKRFNIPDPLRKVMENTVQELGWFKK